MLIKPANNTFAALSLSCAYGYPSPIAIHKNPALHHICRSRPNLNIDTMARKASKKYKVYSINGGGRRAPMRHC